MTDTTTATEASEKAFREADEAYNKCSPSEQDKLRLLASIMLIMSSGAGDEEKMKCLTEAIKAYTCDVVIETCTKFQEGMNQGLSVSTGIRVFISVSKVKGIESYDRLIKMIEALPDPKQEV